MWIGGITLIAVSIPIYSFSLCFASQTAMSMIPTLSILLIMFWSWLLLDEKFTSYDILAISLLTPGTLIILLSSKVTEGVSTSSSFSEHILSTQTILFLSLSVGVFVIGGISSFYILKAHEDMQKEFDVRLSSNRDNQVISDFQTSPSMLKILSYRWNLLPMLYLPWFAGFFWCMSSTLVKSFFILYGDSKYKHRNMFEKIGEPEIFTIMINIGLFTFLSFFMLNKGLMYYEPIYILPFEKVSLLINNILWGGILLREFNDVDSHQIIGFLAGIFLCVSGVLVFLWKKDQTSQMQNFMHEELEEYKMNEKRNSFTFNDLDSSTFDITNALKEIDNSTQ